LGWKPGEKEILGNLKRRQDFRKKSEEMTNLNLVVTVEKPPKQPCDHSPVKQSIFSSTRNPMTLLSGDPNQKERNRFPSVLFIT
jgi:hypothetical protein